MNKINGNLPISIEKDNNLKEQTYLRRKTDTTLSFFLVARKRQDPFSCLLAYQAYGAIIFVSTIQHSMGNVAYITLVTLTFPAFS